MPARRKPVPRRPPTRPEDLAWVVRYFASAGSLYDGGPDTGPYVWLPWVWGSELRAHWLTARDEVARRIPARAFALMDRLLNSNYAPQFENWPTNERRELYALCVSTGCRFRVCVCGHVLGVNEKCPTDGCDSGN